MSSHLPLMLRRCCAVPLSCHYLLCLGSVVGYINNRPPAMYAYLSVSVWRKKESCISLWWRRLYPTGVNQTQVDELPPSYICLTANLYFTLPLFSSLSIFSFVNAFFPWTHPPLPLRLQSRVEERRVLSLHGHVETTLGSCRSPAGR